MRYPLKRFAAQGIECKYKFRLSRRNAEALRDQGLFLRTI